MKTVRVVAVALMLSLTAAVADAAGNSLARVERLYADLVDDAGVVTTIGSGLFATFRSQDLAWWLQRYARQRSELLAALASMSAPHGSAADIRAIKLMRANLDSTLTEDPLAGAASTASSSAHCDEKTRQTSAVDKLQSYLYACFEQFGNRLAFEGQSVARDSAIAMLSQMQEPARRKQLFFAFAPLWEGVNGRNEADSPYRRWIRMAAPKQVERGSDMEAAARDLEVQPTELEHWLEQILETWRGVIPDKPVEPWDYRYLSGRADVVLARAITPGGLLPATQRYYRDLGADPVRLSIRYDLEARSSKAPVTYTSYITMGRMMGGKWRPTTARISANYSAPGLYVLNMLVHETAHAVHYGAIHNRPAFMDIGDNLLCEAFADVTSWDVYDPAWQEKYLGSAVSPIEGLRSQYTMVTLEAAWALFDLRMLQDPERDPNAVWTDITNRYFHIIAHPELSWWAQRVQLVTTPGFMVNYGIGAVITADLRHTIQKSIGPFNSGNPNWYPWVTAHILHWGEELETAAVLRRVLGRPASPEALLADIRRISRP